jgi:hypothetical protein
MGVETCFRSLIGITLNIECRVGWRSGSAHLNLLMNRVMVFRESKAVGLDSVWRALALSP